MKARAFVLISSIVFSQITVITGADASVLVPVRYEFSSSYGVDLSAKLTNSKLNAIDLVPGDSIILDLNAKLVDPSAVDWPTKVEFVESDYNLFDSPEISSYRFKGFLLSAYVYCETDENYFKGNNDFSADIELPWNGNSAKSSVKIKLPKVCDEMTFEFRVEPTLQEIILKGNSKVTGRADLDYWFLTPESSDTVQIGEIRNHINILRWSPIKDVTLGMKKAKFTPKSSAGKVRVQSLSKATCVISGDWILFARTGICNLQISVDSVAGYEDVNPTEYSFEILKSFELQCVKNDKLKLVSGSNPKCPPGFRKA